MNKQSFSKLLEDEAKALPGRTHGWFRTWFRKVWNVRGGGLYACGFAVTFLYLEMGSIVEDFKQIGLLFDGQVFSFVFEFFVDSFKNTISALIWPAHVAQYAPPYGPVALGLAFVLFPMFLKKPIEHWLFEGEPAPDLKAERKEKKALKRRLKEEKKMAKKKVKTNTDQS